MSKKGDNERYGFNAVLPINQVLHPFMRLYKCHRNYCGYDMDAVVAHKSEEEALSLIGWNLDEDTTEVSAVQIAPSSTYIVPTIIAEDTL